MRHNELVDGEDGMSFKYFEKGEIYTVSDLDNLEGNW